MSRSLFFFILDLFLTLYCGCGGTDMYIENAGFRAISLDFGQSTGLPEGPKKAVRQKSKKYISNGVVAIFPNFENLVFGNFFLQIWFLEIQVWMIQLKNFQV